MPGNPFDQFDARPARTGLNINALPAKPPSQTPAQAQKDVAEASLANAKVAEQGTKQAHDAADDLTKKQNAMEATRQLFQAVERGRGLVDGWSTGFWGNVFRHWPGSDEAKQLDSVINQQIRGNIFKNWVASLKAQTDTGTSGIGRIMQSEIPLVTGATGALDPIGMGADETRKSLDQIENGALRSAALLNGENPDDPVVVKKYRGMFSGAKQAEQASGKHPSDITAIMKKYGG